MVPPADPGYSGARLQIELGEAPHRALGRVRKARPHAVETVEQENYVLYEVVLPCNERHGAGAERARKAG